jgi:hypothetical protein
MSVWQRLYTISESVTIDSIPWRSALKPSSQLVSTHSGQPGNGKHDRHGPGSERVLPDMLLTRRPLPVINGRLSPHGHKLRPKDFSCRQDVAIAPASSIKLPEHNLGLHSAGCPPHSANILGSGHVSSATSHESDPPHIAKVLWSRPEYGTLVESLPARETYVENGILRGELDFARITNKKGRDQDISRQPLAGIVAQKPTKVRRQTRAFSTTQVSQVSIFEILLLLCAKVFSN